MLKINKVKEYYIPFEQIELSDEIKETKFTLHFKCDDGVDFDIKIDNESNESFKYTYSIPRGMSGQTYHITLKCGDYVSNEVLLNVEKNIITYVFKFNDKSKSIDTYIDIYENKFFICLDELNELFIDSNKHKMFERLSLNKLMINDIERRYYTYNHFGKLFMYINDCKNVFDIDFEELEDNIISINNREYFDIDRLDQMMHFSYLHGCLLGDIDTGKLLYWKNEEKPCAIASTTKLLTLFLTREKIEEGYFDYDTLIEIPEEAEYEALSEDGVVYLEKGKMVPLKELMIALMLPSSNESAITLACAISGSESEFAKLMNKKCSELKLENSWFYNASGLPYYGDKLNPTKLQNRMSAIDMFKLVRAMINKYPDLLEITSLKRYHLETLDVTLTNTNPVLFNMDECVGLKTGTTNRAGCCLVSLCKFNDRRIVSIVFGAESSQERGEVSETLLKFAKGFINKNGKTK